MNFDRRIWDLSSGHRLHVRRVINKGIARGGPRIMLPMGVMGALVAVAGLFQTIRGLL